MALEYPKFLPKLNDDGSENDEDGITVHDAREEATAVARGYQARPSSAKGQQHAETKPIVQLDYPKTLYKRDGDALLEVVVTHADDEAAAVDDGYAAVAAPAEGDVHSVTADAPAVEEPASPSAPKAPKAGKKPKAPKAGQ